MSILTGYAGGQGYILFEPEPDSAPEHSLGCRRMSLIICLLYVLY